MKSSRTSIKHSVFSWVFVLVLAMAFMVFMAFLEKAEAGARSAPAPAHEDPLTIGLETISSDELVGHIRKLASDDFEGRAPGTAGEKKTTAYLKKQLRAAGVEPANGKSYFQRVPLVTKQVQGRPGARISKAGETIELTFGEDLLIGAGIHSERASVKGSELVFAGYGIVASEYGWDDYGDVDVRGKTVVVLPNDPGRTSDDPEFFKGRALTWYGTSSYKREEAARRGARAVVVIYDPEVIGAPWATLTGGAGKPDQGLVPEGDAEPRTEINAMISQERGRELFELAGLDPDAQFAEAKTRDFQARPLGLKFEATVETELTPSESFNVVGLIRGSTRPDEYVLYTAHWDHVGIGKPVDGDEIYNGAVDNATGTAALLEIAEAFASLPEPPARSVVLLATTAEEQGLLGSFHYADHPLFPLDKTVAVINMDALFPFDDFNGMTVVALGSSEVEDYLAEAAGDHGRQLVADPQPEFGAFFRSDHYPLAKKGVPAIFAVGGPLHDPPPSEDLIKKFMAYMQTGYHKPGDEYRDDWDMRGILGDVRIFFQTGYTLAQTDDFPNWVEGHEFRKIRDASR